MSGVDIPTLSAILGHKQIQMTMRYSHLAPDPSRQRSSGSFLRSKTNWGQIYG